VHGSIAVGVGVGIGGRGVLDKVGEEVGLGDFARVRVISVVVVFRVGRSGGGVGGGDKGLGNSLMDI